MAQDAEIVNQQAEPHAVAGTLCGDQFRVLRVRPRCAKGEQHIPTSDVLREAGMIASMPASRRGKRLWAAARTSVHQARNAAPCIRSASINAARKAGGNRWT